MSRIEYRHSSAIVYLYWPLNNYALLLALWLRTLFLKQGILTEWCFVVKSLFTVFWAPEGFFLTSGGTQSWLMNGTGNAQFKSLVLRLRYFYLCTLCRECAIIASSFQIKVLLSLHLKFTDGAVIIFVIFWRLGLPTMKRKRCNKVVKSFELWDLL